MCIVCFWKAFNMLKGGNSCAVQTSLKDWADLCHSSLRAHMEFDHIFQAKFEKD
jgi:hypothetical protein